jgi:hypothetical protein
MFLHAWALPREIEPERWEPLRRDVVAVLQAVSARLERGNPPDAPAMLRGPQGMGGLVIGPDRLAFNGNAFRHEAGDAFVIERVAERGYLLRAEGRPGAKRARAAATLEGAPAEEDGETPRPLRRAFRRCDTHGHPYDLAVCSTLLTALWHFGDEMRLGTQGTVRGESWRAAADMVRAVLGVDAQLVQSEFGTIRWRAQERAGGRRLGRSAS